MITTFSALPEIRRHNPESTIVFRKGCFDLLHEGHLDALEFSKSQGDLLVIGVVPDERVAERKGPDRPIRNQQSRLRTVDAFKPVDFSFIIPTRQEIASESPTGKSIDLLRPDIFVVQSLGFLKWHKQEDELRRKGTSLIVDNQEKIHSTTGMIKKIISAELSEAQE